MRHLVIRYPIRNFPICIQGSLCILKVLPVAALFSWQAHRNSQLDWRLRENPNESYGSDSAPPISLLRTATIVRLELSTAKPTTEAECNKWLHFREQLLS